ncbi:MAG: ATP-binding protein [Rhodospirillales bacterium]
MTTCGTAGQRAAADSLNEALAKRSPLILLFGEMGVGKSTLLARFLATIDPIEFAVMQLSATGGEFVGSPSFEALLEDICRQLVAPQPTAQRPATLAVLAHAVGLLGAAGRTMVIAIDHADHLANDVISELTKLAKHLDVAPANLVCIFVGSPALAPRLDRVLRKPGLPERLTEIRVSQPSAEELAALLAYEDMAQPGGPMLTAAAIDRITVYAKSNLHWAVPLADAARTLAAAQGLREVTPELVRGALLELWAPDQQPTDSPTPFTFDLDGSMATVREMSDVPRSSLNDTEFGDGFVLPDAAVTAGTRQTAWVGPGASRRAAPEPDSPWSRRVLWIALTALALLITLGAIAVSLRSPSHRTDRDQPVAATPEVRPAPPTPELPAPPAPALPVPPAPLLPEPALPEPSGPPGPPQAALPQSQPVQPPVLEAPADGGESAGLPGDQPSPTVAPAPTAAAPELTLPPPRSREAAPVTAKKAPKPAKKVNEGTRGKWIQTR